MQSVCGAPPLLSFAQMSCESLCWMVMLLPKKRIASTSSLPMLTDEMSLSCTVMLLPET